MLNKRQTDILNYINEHGEAKNSELIALVGNCSPMTLWRDLSKLEEEAHIVRIRGGAAAAKPHTAGREATFILRSTQNTAAKEAIARIAIDLILPGHAYYLDAGSTVFTLTNLITDGDYTFITSAANTACEIIRRNIYSATLLGGQLHRSTLSCSGPQTEAMLGGMNIDIAIMATSGYSINSGFTSGFMPEAQLKKTVIPKASFTIMLMDSSKIGQKHPFTFATLDDIDILVSDAQLPEGFINDATSRGVTIFTPDDGLSQEERIAIYRSLLGKLHP